MFQLYSKDQVLNLDGCIFNSDKTKTDFGPRFLDFDLSNNKITTKRIWLETEISQLRYGYQQNL